MSKATIKTNNDPTALEKKIQLRVNSIQSIAKDSVRVLECFGGEGVLWREVQKRTDKRISTLAIDQKKYKRFQLQGDSLKVLPSLDISKFDVIDLDSYGIPFDHCSIVLSKGFKGIVHCTVIQSGMGNLPNGLLEATGFSKDMMKKARTLLSKNGASQFKSWLANNGVKTIECLNMGRKNYFWFDASQTVGNE
jgi:hypothetical protein